MSAAEFDRRAMDRVATLATAEFMVDLCCVESVATLIGSAYYEIIPSR